MRDEAYHIPVLVNEVTGYFRGMGNGTIIDGTVGGGGHASAILDINPDIQLIGLDKDPAALEKARERLATHGNRAVLLEAGFESIPAVLASQHVTRLCGVLLDLGVSSHQIDTPQRGFSFSAEGPLDMRLSGKGGATAHDLVNRAGVDALTAIFREYGEEPRARRVAEAIVEARAEAPVQSTAALARIVESAGGWDVKAKARIFQALRIAVNCELEALTAVLDSVPAALAPGGRFAVIAYHSLEDRLVKRRFRELSEPRDAGGRRLPGEPEPPELPMRSLHKKAIRPRESETAANSRARSAKLRVIEKK